MAEPQKRQQEQRPVQGVDTPPTYAELRAWCATVQHGNFGLAAQHLGLSQTTVQQLVRNLSGKLGRILGPDTKLYHYQAATRSMRATEVGRRLYEWAAAAVADIDHTGEFLRSLDTNPQALRVAATVALWEHDLLRVTGEIRSRTPTLSLQMFGRGSAGSLDLLRTHQCHVAFVGEPTLVRAATTLPDRVRHHEYAAYEVDLIVPHDAPLARDVALHTALAHAREGDATSCTTVLQSIYDARPLILPGRWSAFRQQLDESFHMHGVVLQAHDIHEFDVGRCILAAVAAKLGIAIQPRLVVDPVLEPSLTRISLKGIIADWRVFALWDPLYMTEPARELVRRLCHVEP